MAAGVCAGNETVERPASRWFHGGGRGYRGLVHQSDGWLRLGFVAGGLERARGGLDHLIPGGQVEIERRNGGQNAEREGGTNS